VFGICDYNIIGNIIMVRGSIFIVIVIIMLVIINFICIILPTMKIFYFL